MESDPAEMSVYYNCPGSVFLKTRFYSSPSKFVQIITQQAATLYPMTQDETYRRVQAQFGRTADAYVESTGHAKGAELTKIVTLAGSLLGSLQGKKALDVATGGGHTALAFARVGAAVTATDLTPEMLAAARTFVQANGGEAVQFAAAAAEALPFEAETFDLVSCRIAAHHFADPKKFVQEAARVLRLGGPLLLVDNVSPEDAALAAIMNEIERRRDPSHVWAYTVRQWVVWLADAGLDVQHLSRWWVYKPYWEWLERAQTPKAAGAALAGDILKLPPAQKAYLQVEESDGGLESLAHEAVLFVGQKR